MSEPLLRIPNHHSATCGDPPIINGAVDHLYIGYFENSYGEQWIFTRDRKTGIATLRGGDIDWNTVIVSPVVNSPFFVTHFQPSTTANSIKSAPSIGRVS